MKFVLRDEMFDTLIDSDFFDAPAIQAIAERLDGQGSKGWIAIVGRHPGYDRVIAIGNAGNFPYMVRVHRDGRIVCEYEAISELHAALTVERMLRNAPDTTVEVIPLEVQE